MKPGNIRIVTQLRLGFALLLALLVGLGGLSHVQTGQLWENARKMHDHSLVVRRAVGDLNAAIFSMRIEFRNFALAGDEADRQAALTNLAAAKADALRRFDILQDRYMGPAADVDAARRDFARWTELHEGNQGLVRAGKTVEAMDRTEKSGDVGRTREHLLEQIHTISEFSRRLADQLFDDTRKVKEAQFHQTVFFSFLALTLALAVSWLLTANIREPLKELSRAMDRFRRGEGEARSAYVSANEFGVVSTAFNEMAETMETQARINDQAAQLAGVMLRESELRSFCYEVLKVMINQTGAQTGAIFLLNRQKNVYECFESIGLSADARASFDASISEGQLGLAVASGQMERITDIPGDARLTIKVVGGEVRLSDIVTIPLDSGETTPAIVSLTSIHKFGENAIRLLMEINSILNARIHGVLAHWRLQTFAEELEAQNMQLEEQKKTIASQAASLAHANAVLETLNRELEMQKSQLEEVSRLKSAFLSNMSHELRTPLNSVLALSQALAMQAGGRLSPEELGYLEIIERNGKNLLTLINGLLDLAKIEAGRVDVHPAPFSLNQTLENLTASLVPLAGEKNIALRLDAPAELPPLESDEIRVTQILQNLMANAVKFTDEGGVTISAESDGQTISVRVADTGIGIAPEYLPDIFEEFRQVDGSASRRYEGTGLGLAIASKAARLVDGDITVESTPGRGSVFTLTLPVKWPGEAPDAAADQARVQAMVGKIET